MKTYKKKVANVKTDKKQTTQQSHHPILWALGIVLGVTILIPILATPRQSTPRPTTADTTETTPIKYGLGSTFTANGLKLTVGDSYSFETIQNRYDERNGQPAIKIPIYMENISDETKSTPIFFTVFDPSGVQVKGDVGSYFGDEATAYVTQLRPQASCQKYLYVVYLGDGLYSADLADYDTSPSSTRTIEINVTK